MRGNSLPRKTSICLLTAVAVAGGLALPGWIGMQFSVGWNRVAAMRSMQTALLATLLQMMVPALAAAETNRKVTSADWIVTWSSQVASAVQVSGTRKVPIYRKSSTQKNAKANDGYWEEQTYAMRSIVGPYVSFFEESYGEGGAHPSVALSFHTVRLGEKAAVCLTELFPEAQVVGALVADRVIVKARSSQEPVTTLEALAGQLDGGCEMDLSAAVFNESFIFHHIDKDKVAIRIGVPHGCEVARGNFTQLGLLLPIPPVLKEALAEAEKNQTLGVHLKQKK